MITLLQIEDLSRKLKTNTTVVAREYIQLEFLRVFYENPQSKDIYFKGGTAIRFLMGGDRFSEDLDFSCESTPKKVEDLVLKTVENVENVVAGLKVKQKKTLAGKSYLLTLEKDVFNFPIFVRLDFSFRENVLQKEKSIIETEYPVIFSAFTHHLGGEEILAEKTRALLTRHKGRDLYDYWFLLAMGYKLNQGFINKKMEYYPKVNFSWERVLDVVNNYKYEKFSNDLAPFVDIEKRARLEELFEIVRKKIVKEAG